MKTGVFSTITIIRTFFLLLSISSFCLTVFLWFLMVLAAGWGGGSISADELIWFNRLPILTSIFAFFAFIGLLKNKKFGWIFGYGLVLGLILFIVVELLRELVKNEFNLTARDILYLSFFAAIACSVGSGLHKIKNYPKKFTFLNLLSVLFLSGILYLSFWLY